MLLLAGITSYDCLDILLQGLLPRPSPDSSPGPSPTFIRRISPGGATRRRGYTICDVSNGGGDK